MTATFQNANRARNYLPATAFILRSSLRSGADMEQKREDEALVIVTLSTATLIVCLTILLLEL